MVKQIIKEAMDKNPIGLKEAVEEELRARVELALEAKKSPMEDEEETDFSEAVKPKYGVEKMPSVVMVKLGNMSNNVLGYEDHADGYMLSFDKMMNTDKIASALGKKSWAVEYMGPFRTKTKTEYTYFIAER